MFNYSFSYEDLEFFLLIFVRISAFIYTAPFFSINNTPRRVKAGFAIFFAFVLYQVLPVHEVPDYNTILGYSVLVLKEAACGVLIGLGAGICNTIVQFAGKIADMEVGLSMVQLMDPLTRDSSGFMGTFYQYAVTLIMLITSFHHYLIRALVDTFTLIPIGTAAFSSENLVKSVLQFLEDYMIISFRICLPIVTAMLLMNCILGILAKTAPQMNMFSVGIQLKILAGFTILLLTIGILPSISENIFNEMKVVMTLFVQSMT